MTKQSAVSALVPAAATVSAVSSKPVTVEPTMTKQSAVSALVPAAATVSGLPSFDTTAPASGSLPAWTRDEAIACARDAMRTRDGARGVKGRSALAFASAAARKLNESKRTTHEGEAYYTGPAILSLLGVSHK